MVFCRKKEGLFQAFFSKAHRHGSHRCDDQEDDDKAQQPRCENRWTRQRQAVGEKKKKVKLL